MTEYVKTTDEGYTKVLRPDGSQVSQHRQYDEALSSAVNEILSGGAESITIEHANTRVEVDVGALAEALGGPVDSPTEPPVDPPSPPPPPVGDGRELLNLDWDTDETSDGGQIVAVGSNGGNFEVRQTAEDARPFSTPDYLRINATGGGWVDAISPAWDPPEIGQTVLATWEMIWQTSVSGQTTHGFYFDDYPQLYGWGPETLGLSIEDSGDRWELGVWTSTAVSPDAAPFRTVSRFPLLKGERYDIAFSYTRTGQNTFRAGMEVSQNGVTIFSSRDFTDHAWYGGTRNLEDQEFTQANAGAGGIRGFRIGNNGLDSPFTGIIAEIANLRVTVE